MYIEGRNAVIEALRAGAEINKVFVAKGEKDSALGYVASLAKSSGVPVVAADRRKLDEMCPGGAHQGAVAQMSATKYATTDDILAIAKRRGESPLIVLCDGISDPRNLGAIVRTCEAAGAHGVIVPRRRSAPLSQAVARASAGAVEYIPVARVPNLCAAIDTLKARGAWVYGADMGGSPYHAQKLKGPVALVIGAEGRGLGRLVKERCDALLSLPMRGRVASLNASVAAGILMYEIAKQQAGGKESGGVSRDP
jgi:23S rRNA (guanosine2251-2'-O)-methyltransferase